MLKKAQSGLHFILLQVEVGEVSITGWRQEASRGGWRKQMQQEFQSGTFSPAAKRKGRRRNVTLCKSWKLTQFEHFKGPWSHWSWSESWLRHQDCLRELFLEASHLPTHQVFSFLCADCDEDKLKHAPVHEHKAANLDYETKVHKTFKLLTIHMSRKET